jgi:hypothetical protein
LLFELPGIHIREYDSYAYGITTIDVLENVQVTLHFLNIKFPLKPDKYLTLYRTSVNWITVKVIFLYFLNLCFILFIHVTSST